MNPKLSASAKENKTKVDKPAIRFTINLGESNENTCPEISYRDIYKESIEKKKQSIDSNELSDLDILQKEDEKNEDERITAIVKNLEARYGVQAGKGKCKKMRNKIADLMDMGIGYDESDSFIDNSEAYDELVPSTMTTKLGGFYINSGLLEYKEIRSSSDDERSLDHHNPHNKHHHPLSAHAHSKQARTGINRKSGTINNGRSLLKKSLSLSAVKSHKNLNNSNRSRHYLSLAKHNKKQFKKSVVDGKVKYLLATPSQSLLQAFESTVQTEEKCTWRSKSDFGVENSEPALEENGKDRNSPKIAPPSQPSDPAHPSSVKKPSKKLNKSAMHLPNSQSPTANNIEITSETNIDREAPNSQGKESKVVPALNLGPEIKELMDELIEIGKQPKSDRSSTRFFTPRVNSILLRIENLTRKTMTFGQRSRLYHMLTGQLPCTRDTLVKKAKRIWLEDRQTKMELTLGLFKKALSNAYTKTTLVPHKDDAENYKESAMKYLKQVIFLRLECLDRHKMSQVPLSGNSLNMVDESLKLYVKQEIDSIRSTLNINVDEQFTKYLLDMVRIVIGSYFAHSYHAKFHKYPPSTLPIPPCSTVDGDNSIKNTLEIYTQTPVTTAPNVEKLERVNSTFPSPTTNTSSQSMEPLAKRKIKPTTITPSPSSSTTSQQVNNPFHNGPRHKSLTPPRDIKERLNPSKVTPTTSREVINNLQHERGGNIIALSPSPPPAKRQDCRSTPSAVAPTSTPNQPRPDAKASVSSSSRSSFAPLPNNEKASASFPYASIHPPIIFPHAPSSHPLFKHYLPPPIIPPPPQSLFPFQQGPGKIGNPNHDELSSFIYNAIQKELHKGSPGPAAPGSRKQQLSRNKDAHLVPGFLHPFSLTNILSQQSIPPPVQPINTSENIPSSRSCVVLPKTSPPAPNGGAKSDAANPSSNNNEHYLITLDDE